MIPIKVRVWDVYAKEMLTNEYLLDNQEYDESQIVFMLLESKKNYIPMLFTGIEDKNGKEIYGGDIFKAEHPGAGVNNSLDDTVIGVAEYDNDNAWFWDGNEFPLCAFDKKTIEVIGDIHRNPELLEENHESS